MTLQARIEGGGTPEMTDWYLRSETGLLRDWVEGEDLRQLLGLLAHLEEQVAILRRLGMSYEEYLARRDPETGAFPFLIATYEGKERLFYSHVEFQEYIVALEEEI